MESYFIVCFDFHKYRVGFANSEEGRSEIAEDYMDTCNSLSERMITRFANKCICLSNNAFLLQSALKDDVLLQLLVAEFTQSNLKDHDDNSVNEQIYLSRIESVSSFAFKEKRFEIEYLLRQNKEH